MAKHLKKAGEKTQFKKGKSGNTAGRPKGAIGVNTRIKRILEGDVTLPEAIQDVIDAKLGKTGGTLIDAIVISQSVLAMKTKQGGSTKACEFLLDRAFGKEPDKLEVETKMDDEDKEILERWKKQQENKK